MSTDSLRLAILSVHSSPLGKPGAKDTGGMSTYIREVACELAKLGISVDIYTRVHDTDTARIIELDSNVRLIHLKAGEDKDIQKLEIYQYLPEFISNLEDFRLRHNLKYDLIFSHYWLSGLVGQALQSQWDVPHVIMFHTLSAIKNALKIGEPEPRLRLKAEKNLAQQCQRIIAATANEKRKLMSYYGVERGAIHVIPCGVNFSLFHPEDKRTIREKLCLPGEKLLLFAGRIEPLKGIDNLLRAMPYVIKNSKTKLLIIGGDEFSQNEIAKLNKLAEELNIQDSISFSGLVKYEKMVDFYNATDVCIVPSYYESFGLVALESLACGTPVVATDVGDMRQVIQQGKTGYVVANNSPQLLADRIITLLSQPTLDMKTRQLIRSSIGRFSWQNTALALKNEFDALLTSYRAHERQLVC